MGRVCSCNGPRRRKTNGASRTGEACGASEWFKNQTSHIGTNDASDRFIRFGARAHRIRWCCCLVKPMVFSDLYRCFLCMEVDMRLMGEPHKEFAATDVRTEFFQMCEGIGHTHL